ncbi:phosphotransferase [Mycobacterium cookii]|uniref:Phosphotransferase n=2 Tax=Mycobacterium cookii TaxID=1775 RepID=A0A7I7KZL4_9MYCO|nr:phosphotransferase [Mycobacterium cookii]
MVARTHDATLLIRDPSQISDGWLGEVLAVDDPTILSVERIGTGQMSQSHRVRFRASAGSGSVIVKLASDNASSRSTGVGMGAYYREVTFYRNVPDGFDGPLARCHLAVFDESAGWFTLVLEDIADATVGDQIRGCFNQQAQLAIGALAQLHAPAFNDAAEGLRDYLNQPNPLNQAALSVLHADVCRAFVSVLDGWAADRRTPLGLIHGDYRLDNLLFTADSCTVVDWQTVSWGPVMHDLAYFVGSSLIVADRRAHEHDLVRFYYDELVRRGVTNFSWDQCWAEYRRQSFACLVITIAAGVVVERTDRGDDMFATVLARVCQQILDLDALSLLPAASSPPAALRPEPADEGRHTPGSEALWNESWYFDAVDATETLGVYVRLGLQPNLGACFFAASIVRPGQPTLMVVDERAPLPADGGSVEIVHTESLRAVQHCVEPMTRFHVTLDATAQAFADHAAPLRDETGEPVPVSIDLTWETDGVPYQWRVSTRYEIPCRVTGAIRIGDQQFAFAGPGQRDHSWGSRDWWANDWMWSAFHLDDGTHTHAVTVPGMPGGRAVGYTQRGDTLTEVQTGASTETAGTDGLISAAQVLTQPEHLVLDVQRRPTGASRTSIAPWPASAPRMDVAVSVGSNGTATKLAPVDPPRSIAG